MKKINNIIGKTGALAVAMSYLVPSLAYATNGLFMIGYGDKSRGMGGASIAMPVDAVSGVSNPANLSYVGGEFDIGMLFFTASVTGELGSTSSDSNVDLFYVNNLFPMPNIAVSYPVNDKYTLGFNMIPSGGGATQYDTNFFQAAGGGDVNDELAMTLIVMESHLSLAYKINKKHSIGGSLVIGTQVFNAKGIQLFDPFTQTQGTNSGFSNQGFSWSLGLGAKFGYLGTFDKFRVGLSYQTKINMQPHEHYRELLAENGNLDIPARAGLGLSYDIKPNWTVTTDITYTWYDGVKSISNLGPNLAGNPDGPLGSNDRQLGLPNGMGFGWNNQTVFKIGTQYAFNEKWTGRLGWNYGKSPIDEDTQIIFNLIGPAISQNHFTAGGTYTLSPTMEVNASYVHAFYFKQEGPTYISDDGSNRGKLEMSQDSLGVSFALKF